MNEFDRQMETLLTKGYPKLVGVSEQVFLRHVEPLKSKVLQAEGAVDLEEGKLPFVITIQSEWLKPEQALEQVNFRGKSGVVGMHPVKPS